MKHATPGCFTALHDCRCVLQASQHKFRHWYVAGYRAVILCRSNGLVDQKEARLKARNEQRERQREQREKRRAAEARARRYPMDDELLRDELIEEAVEQGARPMLGAGAFGDRAKRDPRAKQAWFQSDRGRHMSRATRGSLSAV